MFTEDAYMYCIVASTLYQRRQVNVRKHKRNPRARKQTTDQSRQQETV